MARMWTAETAQAFWSERPCHLVFNYDNLEEKRENCERTREQREQKERERNEKFLSDNETPIAEAQPSRSILTANNTSQNLKFWIENSSWTFCTVCFGLDRQKLLPRYSKRPITKHLSKCKCANSRYVVPSFALIPEPLKNLSFHDISTLRPLDFHCGDPQRRQHGYLQKKGMCHINWCATSVVEKIQALDDRATRRRCRNAYNFLINCVDSSYSTFTQKHLEHLNDKQTINMYNHLDIEGVECALWPNIYPYTSWCETILKGDTSRLSTKISFITKVFSSILDYALQYELLQFHFDLWLFKTVSGAISSARTMNCSPARALNAKTFSPGYWKKQHRLLIDAVDQYGYPTAFVTINPYEWSFPMPKWINNARSLSGCGPTKLAAFETVHIAHVLEQIVRGYLCGSNTNTWNQHLFSYNNSKTTSNIQTYFYRFEFQQRGTVHLHLLVWLKNIATIQHHLVRADIPYEHPETACLVHHLQPSDTGCLPVNQQPTSLEQSESTTLFLYHPQEAFELNLRAYIYTLIPALASRMDFQFTDGKAMVLRYVTSYVSKWKDAYSNEALYSRNVGPYQAAYRHLKDLQPCEPEMWLHMTSMKLSWSNSRTKEFVVPLSQTIRNDKTHNKYMARPNTMENNTFLEWLRLVTHTTTSPKPYKGGSTLVSLKMVSPYSDEFFFQYLLMNYPHRSPNELYHSKHEQLPNPVKFFSSAIHLASSIWNDQTAISEYFTKRGNRDFYVATLCFYIASLRDILQLWEKKVLTNEAFLGDVTVQEQLFQLDHIQTSIYEFAMNSLAARDAFYNSIHSYQEDCSSDEEEPDNDPFDVEQAEPPHEFTGTHFDDCDWRKFILITGKPGSGKSQIVKRFIQQCIHENRKVLVSCPTGLLASDYSDTFSEEITADTVHSAFQFPVNQHERPTINWSISNFDVVIIDELSMIPHKISEHVIRTMQELPIRPLVIMCGDNQQQQPIETIQQKTVQVTSILSDKNFYSLVYHYTLKSQHRILDEEYEKFLNHIRYWTPTQRLLDKVQEKQIVCSNSEEPEETTIKLLMKHTDATVLTVSRRAAVSVNTSVINTIFKTAQALAMIQYDCDMPPAAVYKDMRVIVTQNRDKTNGVVNGKPGVIYCVQNATVFLKLKNNRIVATYPVTVTDQNGIQRTCYPFAPAYALTITKSQGQTLNKVIVWFDTPKASPGSAYVALSRIRRNEDLILITRMFVAHVQPVTNTYLAIL